MESGERSSALKRPRSQVVDSVTVIIPTRNRHHLVERAVASVLSTGYPNIQMLIVDDNPHHARLRAKLAPTSPVFGPNIEIIENDAPRNAARARNIGLMRVKTPWVMYLDDDDEYKPDKIRRQVDLCTAADVPLALCGFAVALPFRRAIRQVSQPKFTIKEVYTRADPRTPVLIHRADPHLKFDEELDAHEDADFLFTATRYFGLTEVHLVPDWLVTVHPQPGPRVNTAVANSWRSQRRIYSKHFAGADRFLRRSVIAQMLLSKRKHAGSLRKFLIAAYLFLATRGACDFRAVVNAALFRIRPLRRLLVS